MIGTCDDPPDLVVNTMIEGTNFGDYYASDTPVAGGTSWYGSLGFIGPFAMLTDDRSYDLRWEDNDVGDPNDPISSQFGFIRDEDLRRGWMYVGEVRSGTLINGLRMDFTPQPL